MSAAFDSAFARPASEVDSQSSVLTRRNSQSGLTKREYFAACALQGLMSREGAGQLDSATKAALAFRAADAMVAHLDTEVAAQRARGED